MPIQYNISRKTLNGKAEVYIRFYKGALNQRAKTGIYVPVSLWSAAEGRCIISRRYNTPDNAAAAAAQAELDALTNKVLDAYMSEHGKPLPPDWLDKVIHTDDAEPPLYTYIQDYCNSRSVAQRTAQKMQSMAYILQDYARTHTHIYAHTLTPNIIEEFAIYLRRDRHYAHNSVCVRLRQLRTLLYWVGKPNPNPFDAYAIPNEIYGTPIYLTKEERDTLARYADLKPSQQIQRDIFIFQCHTGCRISDLYALTYSNISDGWLIYVPKKTSKHTPATVEVPLTTTALQIIERYKGVDKHGRLLPFITEQSYNRVLPIICQRAGLTRSVIVLNPSTFESQAVPLWSQVTSHTARKTFTQIAYTMTGDKRIVATMTGHTDTSQAFNRYSDVSREIKRGILDKLE